MKIETQILNMWKSKGVITNDDILKKAKEFAKAIATMDCDDNEKIYFASGIKKIFLD